MGYFFESLYLPEDSSQEFAQNGCPERAAAAIVQSIMWTTRRPQRGQTDANRREPRIVQKSSVRLRGDGCKPGIAYPRRIQHPIEPMVRIELCGYAPQNAPKACYNLLVKWTKQPSERPESEGEWGQPQYPGPPARLKNSLADLSTSNSQPAKPPRWSTTGAAVAFGRYLRRRGCTWVFRFRWPAALAACRISGELSVSLKTGD